MASDFLLDMNSHDIDISTGTMQLLASDEMQVVAQRVKIALQIRVGEYFRNVNIGIPYFNEFFLFKNNKAYVDQYLIGYIEQIDGVDSVDNFTSDLNEQRKLNITVDIKTKVGTTTLTLGSF